MLHGGEDKELLQIMVAETVQDGSPIYHIERWQTHGTNPSALC